jgi:hypothetical protein
MYLDASFEKNIPIENKHTNLKLKIFEGWWCGLFALG